MTRYEGVEKVDPVALEAQRALTAALWDTLLTSGFRPGSEGRIDSVLLSTDELALERVRTMFRGKGWTVRLEHAAETARPGAATVTSPRIRLTRQALMELVEVMMVAAVETSTTFDGFQIDLAALHERPWWKLW